MPKLLKFDEFTLLICEKNVTNYALLRCKTFSLKNWLCKIFDKYHVWTYTGSSGQAIVRAGTFWGVLNASLRASGTQLGLDLTCFVIVICHPSSERLDRLALLQFGLGAF